MFKQTPTAKWDLKLSSAVHSSVGSITEKGAYMGTGTAVSLVALDSSGTLVGLTLLSGRILLQLMRAEFRFQ